MENYLTMLHNPLDFSRKELMSMYEILEDIRNSKRFDNQNINDLGKNYIQNIRISFEVWMSTIGSGIITKRFSDVDSIWNILISSSPKLNDTIKKYKTLSSITNDDFFIENTENEINKIVDECIPSVFKH